MVNRKMQTADALARVTLPAEYAETTVVVEVLSPSEVRIRRIGEADDELSALPESAIPTLTDRDRDRFLELIASPPAANAALRKAMANHRRDG